MEYKTKRIQFFKGVSDDFGMPTDFQSYLIRARRPEKAEVPSSISGIARVYTMSRQAISISPDHFLSEDGLEGAIEKAVEELKNQHPSYHIKEFNGE